MSCESKWLLCVNISSALKPRQQMVTVCMLICTWACVYTSTVCRQSRHLATLTKISFSSFTYTQELALGPIGGPSITNESCVCLGQTSKIPGTTEANVLEHSSQQSDEKFEGLSKRKSLHMWSFCHSGERSSFLPLVCSLPVTVKSCMLFFLHLLHQSNFFTSLFFNSKTLQPLSGCDIFIIACSGG